MPDATHAVMTTGVAASVDAGIVRRIARRALPAPARQWLRAVWPRTGSVPPVGAVRFGSLRRVTPLSRRFGRDRGLPVDRYYIERFLAARADDIHGRVLEVADATYTRRFGGTRVTTSDVLHVDAAHPQATIAADLTRAAHVPTGAFDCIVLTQTLPFIYDARAAVATVHRILKPGGVVLATVGGISQISRGDMERWGQYWSFTTLSARRLFEGVFDAHDVQVESHGNVLAATAFLYGIAAHELRRNELDHHDPDYQLVITIRARKSPRADERGVTE